MRAETYCKFKLAQVLGGGPAQDVLPLGIDHQNVVVSGESWRLFKEVNPGRSFKEF